ncbi:MAG: ABC transporter ATP-binding protein [Pseudomonadota bacterium]
MAETIVDINDLSFAWANQPPLLEIEAFSVSAAERVFLRGPSGSGKSTLLGLIAGVLPPQTGHLSVNGKQLTAMTGNQRDRLRADQLGVIFQMFNLVPYLSLLQNVILPCRFSKRRFDAVKVAGGPQSEARRLLQRLGLEGETILNRKVTDLSVGQQQRVAAARALIGRPSLIIADEPTSALDADARNKFIGLLSEEAEKSGAAMLFVSHDASLAHLFDRSVDLSEINTAQHEMA